MSWGEIKKALNSTVGKGMKTLDDIIEENAHNAYYDISVSCRASGTVLFQYGITEIQGSYELVQSSVVILPITVEKIGTSAFADGKLSGVRLPPRLNSIGAYGFARCNSLVGISIPKSVSAIGANAFANCEALRYVAFRGKPSSIGENIFSGSAVLDIYVPWSEGEVDTSNWGVTNATFHYNYAS